jgi:PEP-CTERM motif-containing protein
MSLNIDEGYTTECNISVGVGASSACDGTLPYSFSASGITPLSDFTGGSIAILVSDMLANGTGISNATPGPVDCCSVGSTTGTNDATVTLQYTFTPAEVPEPSSLALLGAALALFLLPVTRRLAPLVNLTMRKRAQPV